MHASILLDYCIFNGKERAGVFLAGCWMVLLATMIDLFYRKIVEWSMAYRMRA